MSSPPDDYAPPASHSHKRQDSHSYFRTSDPYRAVRKSTTPDSAGSSQQTDHHSRTASESSTSRLAPAAGSRFNGYEYYDDDPYALPPRHETQLNKKTRRKQHHQSKDERANSYLPYSHHRRDPYAAQEPIYLEEDNMPSFNTPNKNSMGGVGSLLQDNIVMDMVDQQPPAVAQKQVDPTLDPLPEIKKRKRSRRLCGLRRRTLVFIVFIFVVIVAVIWYFVWPRYPPLYYLEAKAPESNWQPTFVTSTWYVNMTADNSDNWVPTRIQNLEVELFDANTNQKFGSGSSGSITLPARQSNINVPFTFNIHYSASDQQDATLQDLTLCSAVKTNPTPESPESLNVIFQVTYHIEGIAWTKQSTVRPSGFQCPDSS